MHKILHPIFILCLFVSNGFAADQRTPQKINLIYKAYWGGFVISKVYGTVKLDPKGYEVNVSYEVTGLASIFSKAKNRSFAQGVFAKDGSVKPLAYESTGSWSKNSYRNHVKFREQDSKIISHKQNFKFKEEVKYIPVREELKYGPDLISFYLGLMVSDEPLTKWTELQHQNVFGGFFLFDIAYRCPATDTVDSSRSTYKGEAIICQFSDKIIDGGFERVKKKKKKKAKKKKIPEPVKIWFTKTGGIEAMIPVYSEFSIGWGKVRVYLADIEVIDNPNLQKVP